jgi:proline iminopeptidase
MKKSIPIIFVVLLLFSLKGISQNEGIAMSSDNAPIHYKIFGTGKPVLIINGGPGMNCNGFEGLAIKLSQNNQTIIYDQRGTGKSTLNVLDTSTITLQLMMDDIESLRKHLGVEKWTILGHSFGGMLASAYASSYKEHIEKLILSSSGGIDLSLLNYVGASLNSKLSAAELDSLQYWNKRISEGDTSYHARLGRGKALAPAYVYNKKFVPIIAERLTQGNNTVNQLIWYDLRKIEFDCSKKLGTFEKPVLIIQGRQDIIKTETAEKAHAVLKHSKIVIVDNCSHYGWLDNETEYLGEINSFLASKP